MQHIQPLHPDRVPLAGKGREHDVRRVSLHYLANLIQPVQKNGVNLGRRYLHVLDEDSNSHCGVMKPLLGHVNRLLRVTSDEDFVGISAARVRRAVAVHLREWRREVYGSAGGRLDQLDVLPVAAANDLVNRQLQLGDVDVSAELYTG